MPNTAGSLHQFQSGEAHVEIHSSASAAGDAAAEKAAHFIRAAISDRGKARVIAATGNSQIPLVEAFVKQDIAALLSVGAVASRA